MPNMQERGQTTLAYLGYQKHFLNTLIHCGCFAYLILNIITKMKK